CIFIVHEKTYPDFLSVHVRPFYAIASSRGDLCSGTWCLGRVLAVQENRRETGKIRSKGLSSESDGPWGEIPSREPGGEPEYPYQRCNQYHFVRKVGFCDIDGA